MIPALIGAAGSLLGGLFNKSPSAYKQSRQGILGQAAGAREAAAQYGFNPLTLLGVSSPIGAASGPMMGSSISDAFSLLADSLANRPGVGEKEALTRENADLRDQLRQQTLQPQVPGIYPRMLPPRPRPVAAQAAEDNVDPLNRPVDVVDDTNISGWSAIQNRGTAGAVWVPGSGEPWGLDEAATAFLFGTPQVAWNYGRALGSGIAESRDRERQRRAGRSVFRGGDGRLYAQQPDESPSGRSRRAARLPSFGFAPNATFGF